MPRCYVTDLPLVQNVLVGGKGESTNSLLALCKVPYVMSRIHALIAVLRNPDTYSECGSGSRFLKKTKRKNVKLAKIIFKLLQESIIQLGYFFVTLPLCSSLIRASLLKVLNCLFRIWPRRGVSAPTWSPSVEYLSFSLKKNRRASPTRRQTLRYRYVFVVMGGRGHLGQC